MSSKLCDLHANVESKANICTHRQRHSHIYRDFPTSNSWIHKTVCMPSRADLHDSLLTAPVHRQPALCFRYTVYIESYSRARRVGERWGSWNTTWINRNQTLDGGGFGTLSGDIGESVKGYGNRVWQGGHDGQQPLSEHQVVMRELGGKGDVMRWIPRLVAGEDLRLREGPLTHLSPVRALASFTHSHMRDSRHASVSFCIVSYFIGWEDI